MSRNKWAVILGCGVLAVLFAIVPANVNAHVVSFSGSCSTELEAVHSAIHAGVFMNPVDQTNLLAKLDEAASKLDAGKTAGAVAKLEDIEAKALALAGAPKPKLTDATAIVNTVDDAIACVNS